jgi:eukaryotic-like serine/threonine-protein kinase
MIDAIISHYRIVQKLGRGGTGNVYKAVDTRLHRFVALKFLPDEIAHDSKALSNFQHTVLALSTLSHPNICPIFDMDVQNSQTFFATEFLDGPILKLFIAAKPLETQIILNLAIEIAEGLSVAHSKGIIHGNLKPSTVIVTHGQARLLDFGLARPVKNASPSGDVQGHEAYLSPEQIKAQDLDARTDIFSLGAVLYEMCTGLPPFTGSTPAAIFKQVLESTPVSALQCNPNLPAAFETILSKALEKEPSLRYPTMTDMKAALETLQRDTYPHVGPSDDTPVSMPTLFPPAKSS